MNLKWVLKDREKGTIAPPPEYLEFVRKKRKEFFWLNGTTSVGCMLFAIAIAYLLEGSVTRDVAVEVLLWNVIGMFFANVMSYMA